MESFKTTNTVNIDWILLCRYSSIYLMCNNTFNPHNKCVNIVITLILQLRKWGWKRIRDLFKISQLAVKRPYRPLLLNNHFNVIHWFLFLFLFQFLIYGSYFSIIAGIFLMRSIYIICSAKCGKEHCRSTTGQNPSEREDSISNTNTVTTQF